MVLLSSSVADTLISAAISEARRLQLGKMGIVVTDVAGEIIVARREDGAGALSIQIALGKARTALAFNMTSLSISEILSGNPAAVASLSTTLGGRLLFMGGGVPIPGPDGELIGAMAAAGDAPTMDEAICKYAVAALPPHPNGG